MYLYLSLTSLRVCMIIAWLHAGQVLFRARSPLLWKQVICSSVSPNITGPKSSRDILTADCKFPAVLFFPRLRSVQSTYPLLKGMTVPRPHLLWSRATPPHTSPHTSMASRTCLPSGPSSTVDPSSSRGGVSELARYRRGVQISTGSTVPMLFKDAQEGMPWMAVHQSKSWEQNVVLESRTKYVKTENLDNRFTANLPCANDKGQSFSDCLTHLQAGC